MPDVAELTSLFERAASRARDEAARASDGEGVAAAALTASGATLVGVWIDAMVDSACLCAETGPICEAHVRQDPIVATVCVHWAGGPTVLPACGVCQERLATFGTDVLIAVRSSAAGIDYLPLRELRPSPWWDAVGTSPARRDEGPGMASAEGARTFITSADAYDSFMGRYSRPLSVAFADAAGVAAGQSALDVGCGPGALTGVLVDRLGARAVSAFDPSPPFVAECASRHPGVDVRLGRAEAIPFDDGMFDRALAQLVLHFVTDPDLVARELRRVLRPGGIAAACVWDFAEGMEMLRSFWDAADAIAPTAPDEARTMRFGGAGEISELLDTAGFVDIAETTLTVGSTYGTFDELWSGFLAGVGPAGSFCVSLSDEGRAALRGELFTRVGSPNGEFTLSARARCSVGRKPR